MAWFQNMSLRWKLALVTVLTTIVALVLSGIIMASYDASSYERQKAGAIVSEAEILAASVSAALVFADQQAAQEYLAALDANPEVVAAAAYDSEGVLVTSYIRKGETAPIPTKPGARGYAFQGNDLTTFVPVVNGKSTIGMVYLKAQVEPVVTRLARYIGVSLAIGLGSLALALPISLWLHRLISNPLEQLAASNAIIKTTLDSVDHGVVVADRDLNVTFVNDRALALFGTLTPAQVLGANFETLMQESLPQLGLSAARRELDLERLHSTRRSRDQYVLPDGKTIEYRHVPLPQGGFVRTYTDITEEKRLQEQLQGAKAKAEQADKAKSQFLAAMSHEIRTPMNGVIGIVELLRSTHLADEQKQMVEIIRQSGIGLLDVINDILDYSKIEAGRMSVEKTPFALAEIVETTAGVVGGHSKSKFLDVACFVDPAIDATVIGDPVRIRQVILNLLGNAIKFTERGTVALSATLDKADDNEIVVLVKVSDTGIGIDSEKQTQLFQPFTQADYSTTRRFGGTGLGLSISRNLVELMGGRIGVNSETGKGSTFWFRMPFGRMPAAERGAPFARYSEILAGLRVLVCDSIGGHSAAAAYLRAVGVEVIETPDPARALTLLNETAASGHPVDLAIVNARIDDDSAVPLAEEIKRREPLRNTEIVLIVPHLSAGAAQMAARNVFAASVPAPLQRGRFYETIAYAAGRESWRPDAASEIQLNFTAPSIETAQAAGALILVAEDNQTNLFVIKSQLQRLGYAAEFVSDGRQAWETYCRDEIRYGLLITDCHMPYVDGYQLTGRIRKREEMSGRHLPIVALTANALEGEAEVCSAAGMDGYMFKPTDLPTLDAMIQKWIPRAATLRTRAETPKPGDAKTAKTARANPPIDTGVMAKLIGNNDPAYLQEMLELYWSSEAETPLKLQELADARDGTNLALAAHAAKGAAASAGANVLAGLCKDLEKSAAQEDWPTVERLSPKIATAFQEIRAFIEEARPTA